MGNYISMTKAEEIYNSGDHDECSESGYVYQLWYYPEVNYFVDCGGYIIYSIFDIITPNDLFLFKQSKGYMLTKSIDGKPVELFYPDYIDEDYFT